MAKTLDFNKPITTLEGKETGETVGKVLASILAMQAKGDPLKYMSWALDMHAGKTVDLDPSDLETLKSFVTSNEQMTNLLKYHILNIINS